MIVSQGSRIVFKNGTVITGRLGETLLDGVVVVDGGSLSYVGSETAFEPQGTRNACVFDISGLVLMPGMIDCHIHFWGARTLDYLHRALVPDPLNLIRAVKDAEALVRAGFTTVRDAGSNKAVYLRQAVEEGTLKGPRILSSHKVLCITGGHYDLHFLPADWVRGLNANFRLVDGPDQCRKAVRDQVREGADFIKICTTGGIMSRGGDPQLYQFSPEELDAIVSEAHAHGRRVSAHAYGKVGITHALDAGVDTIEHGTYMDKEIAARMVDNDVWLVPTLSILRKIATEGAALGMSPWAVKKAEELNRLSFDTFRIALETGVRIASGTDFSGCPPMRHGDNALEPILMVEAGMSNTEALTACTSGAAEAIGLGGVTGTLEPGKSADLIVIQGNPLKDIAVLSKQNRIHMVMRAGEIVVNDLPGSRADPEELPMT